MAKRWRKRTQSAREQRFRSTAAPRRAAASSTRTSSGSSRSSSHTTGSSHSSTTAAMGKKKAARDADPQQLYAVLELAPGASADDIKRSYRKLAVKHHPDKNQGDDASKARFQKISEAYAILSDAEKRKFYDETGELDDVPVSSEEFVSMFNDLMSELMDGDSILEMVEGMSEAELAEMPPFSFPKELFPKGTFPPGCASRRGRSPAAVERARSRTAPPTADSSRGLPMGGGMGGGGGGRRRGGGGAKPRGGAGRRRQGARARARGGGGRMGLDEEDEMAMMELVMEVMETGEMPPGMPPDVMEELLADAARAGYCRRG